MKPCLRRFACLCLLLALTACHPPPAAPAIQTTAPLPSRTNPPPVRTATPTAFSSPPIPSATLTTTVTASVTPAAWGRTLDTINCRQGPSTNFAVSRSLPVFQEIALLGLNPERTWWLVLPPDAISPCWVSGPLIGSLRGDPAAVPLADAPPTPTPIPQDAGGRSFTDREYEDTLFDLLNLARSQHGLPPAQRNPLLDTAARLHSQDMADHDFFSHLSYDGRDFNTRLTAQGLTFTNGGETIYAGGDPYQAWHIWMASEVHRNIILHPAFTALGVGVAYAKEMTYEVYVTADFAALYVP